MEQRQHLQSNTLLGTVEEVVLAGRGRDKTLCEETLLDQRQTIADTDSIVSKTDVNGIITYVNDAFCSVSGYTREELIGQSHSIVRHPKMPTSFFQELWATIRAKKIWRGVIHNRNREGKRYTLESRITPIVDADGNIIEFIAFRKDITDKIDEEFKVRLERKKLEDILNHVDSIVAMVGVTEKLIFVNRKFFDHFPYENFHDFKQKHQCICEIFELREGYLHPMMGESYWIDYVLNHPEHHHRAVMIDRKRNERIFSVNVQKIHSDNQEMHVVTLSDITQIQRAKEEANALAKMKGDFLANMSHEIRTPMNGILGFTTLLSETSLDEKQKKYLDIITHSTQSLLEIINDILDFSKIESGKLELDPIVINPIIEFDKIGQLFIPKIEEKHLDFSITIEPTLSECIRIDLLRIQQIISNLLSNAIKFTPEKGNIHFYAHRLEKREESVVFRMGVRDSGIGISLSHQKKIFEPFSQADSSTTRQFGGTGLGLSISTHLVALMGGTLSLESQEGEGSNFYFDIEAKTCTLEHPLSELFSDEMVSIIVTKKHIQYQHQVERYLDQLGIPYVLEYSDEPTELWTKEHLFIVFCDVSLSLIEWLNEYAIASIMIGKNTPSFLTLPNMVIINDLEYNFSALYTTLLFRATTKLSSLSLESGTETQESGLSGRILVAEDNKINQMLIEEYLRPYGFTVVLVENGQEAVDALEEGHYDLIFMDVNMPVMSGDEAVKIIKERGITTPVVALTANAMEGDRERFLTAGFDYYLSKPIILKNFEKVLFLYLAHPEQMKGNNQLENVLTVDEKILDMDLIRSEIDLPDAIIYQVLTLFVDNSDTMLSDLKEAIASKNYKQIQNVAHGIRGSSGSLRLKALEALTKEIELNGKLGQACDYEALYQQFAQMVSIVKKEINTLLATAPLG
jgi:PAS domain S-box-containing protein